jgi:mannose-6-phosphate isomerase-like protein (cupin superfamily)
MHTWQVVRTLTIPWQQAKRKGIWEKSLLHDPVRHRSTRIIKVDPGAEIPAHRHVGDEETLVLEGRGKLGNSPFEPGDYHRAPSGSLHPSYSSQEGCVFLIFSGTEYEFPAAPLEPSSSEQFMTVRSGVGPWKAVRPGLDTQALFSASTALLATTTLVRLKAGGAVSSSEFSISEAYLLEGHAHIGSTVLSAGDYLQATESGQPVEFQSQQGCTLLIRSAS